MKLTPNTSPAPATRRQLSLGGLALGVLLILVCVPATRKFVTAQTAATLFPDAVIGGPLRELGVGGDLSAGEAAARDDARLRAAARHPNDFPVQLTCALNAPTAPEQLSRLHALGGRFGDRPSLWASVLRVYARGTVTLGSRSNEVRAVLEPPFRHDPAAKRLTADQPPAPGDLAAFDQAAARGEALDPNNALFPLLRAAGLFAAARDDDALDVLRRAGQKTTWNDYIADEATGRWRLAEYVNGAWGTTGALVRSAQGAAILLPHYALIRNGARLGLVHAIEAEKAGRTVEGLELRRALARSGQTLRKGDGFLIGNFVGAALTQMTIERPAGAPLPNGRFTGEGFAFEGDATSSARIQAAVDRARGAYFAYLKRIGAPDEARWMREELEANDQTRQRAAQIIYQSPLGAPVQRLAGWWILGLLTIANIGGLVALGGLAVLLARTRIVQRGPIRTAARTSAETDGEIRPARRALGVSALTMATVLFVAFVAREQARATVGVIELAHMFGGAAWSDTNGVNWWDQAFFALRPFAPLLTLIVPLLLVIGLGVASRVVGVPLTAGIIRGLKGIALPAACVLVIVYGGLILATVRQDARIDGGLRQTLAHEGRYLAARAGVRWPE